MTNSRTQKRWQLVASLRVYDNTSDELIGHLFDVTTEGIRLISDNPIATDKKYEFRMTMPTNEVDEQTCQLTARSIWSKEDDDPNFFDTGFQLVEASADTKSHLNQLINELKVSQSSQENDVIKESE